MRAPFATPRQRSDHEVEIGRRVRKLRVACGLTQKQLGGAELTKGYVSLIESGRTRMSLKTLHVIAERLGVEVGELIVTDAEREAHLALLRAQAAAASGDDDLVTSILDGARPALSGLNRAKADRLRARLLIERDPAAAVALLEGVIARARSLARRDLLSRALLDLARAQLRLERPGEALSLGLEVERILAAREFVDRSLELELLGFLSGVFMALGDYDGADARAQRALAAAQDVGDPANLAQLYANLSTIREEQDDFEAAIGYAQRGLAIRETIGTAREIARLWNNVGWLLIRRGRLTKASEALLRAERMGRANKQPRLLAMVTATRAELAAARGDDGEAMELASRAAADPDASAFCRTQATLVRAEALTRRRVSLEELRAAYDDVLAVADSLPRQQRALIHEAYYRALVDRGQHELATAQADAVMALLRPRPAVEV